MGGKTENTGVVKKGGGEIVFKSKKNKPAVVGWGERHIQRIKKKKRTSDARAAQDESGTLGVPEDEEKITTGIRTLVTKKKKEQRLHGIERKTAMR